MLYTITNGRSTNSRPTSIGAVKITPLWGVTYVFTVANFTTETIPAYSDPEGDALSYIKVITLPDTGTLRKDGIDVIVGQLIKVGAISTGNFTYIPDVGSPSSYSTSFEFDCADAGSNSLSGLPDGVVGITVAAQVNLPPDSVGDNVLATAYATTLVLTSADFTSNTTPAYSDPEGDAAYKLKVTTLPSAGTLSHNGSPVLVNQEILFSEIDSGYLTYAPDVSIFGSQSLNFDFSISDIGSEQFSS